jgi:RNA recognition motif-containing protein
MKVKRLKKYDIYIYNLNNITQYSSMINHFELYRKQNKSRISWSKSLGVYKNYVELVSG